MNDLDLHRRLTAIERRLARLEGIDEAPKVEEAAEVPTPAAPAPPPLPDPWNGRPARIPALPVEPIEPVETVETVEYARVAPPPAPARAGTFEQTVGLKWAAWGGAILSVVAVALGVKYAYDHGWLGGLPDAAKLALMSGGGFALIAAGEWVYRRVNRLSAVGLYAAGVATLFVVSYAGFGFYQVYARETAFALMALSTLVGAAVAVRGKLASVGILSIVGGNVAPLLLRGDATSPVPLLLYLLMLQSVALFLAWWGAGPKWWSLRGVALATTGLWTAALLFGGINEGVILTAACGFALLFQLELILSALRTPTAGEPSADRSPGAVFSLLVTALLAVAVFYVSREQPDLQRGLWLNLIAACVAALGGGLAAWRRNRFAALAGGFAVQAGALVVASVPVALGGAGVVLAWAALAVAFAGLGKWLKLDGPRVAAVATWGLAAGWLAWSCATPGDAVLVTWGTVFSTAIPVYLLLAGVVMLAGHSVALLIVPKIVPTPEGEGIGQDFFCKLSHLLNAGAAVTWGVAAVAALPALGATVAILCHAWGMVLIDYAFPRRALAVVAACAVVAAGVKWAALDLIEPRFAPDYSPAGRLLLNGRMAAGLLIAGSLAGVGWLKRGELARTGGRGGTFSVAVAWGVIGILTVGLAFEIDSAVAKLNVASWPADQVRQLSWTVLLAAALAAAMGVVRWMVPDPDRRASLARIPAWGAAALVAKYVMVDTLWFRLTGAPADATVVANGQVLAGAAAAGAVLLGAWLARGRFAPIAAALIAGLLLFVGSVEVDRWASNAAAPATGPILRQAGWSVWWGGFAVAAVVIGFARRLAPLRYFGLALLAVTLAKVVLVDFTVGGVGTGLRILSFAGLGVLLLGTSVLYGKLSPRLLGEAEEGERRTSNVQRPTSK